MKASNSMYSVVRPMFIVSKVLGLAPFEVTSKKTAGSKIAVLWSIILTTILTAFSLISVTQRPRKQYNSTMLNVGDDLAVYMDVIGMTLSIICCILYRNSVVEAINILVQIDKELKTFNYVIDLQALYKKNQKVIIFLTTCLAMYFLIYIVVSIATYFKTFSILFIGNVVAYVWPTVTDGLIELQFCVLTILIKKRICWLNNQVMQVGEILWKPSFSNKDPTTMVLKTKYFHQKLCDLAEIVNKAYSFQLLFMLIAVFLNSIMTLFYWAIQSVPENKTKIFIADVIYMNNKFIFGIIQILVLVYVCSSTSQEAKKTSRLIHDIIPPSNMLQNRESLQIQLSCFSLQLANHNIEFNACGIFPINESLIYSIIGAASAYLVIVIQFELSSNNPLTDKTSNVTVSP